MVGEGGDPPGFGDDYLHYDDSDEAFDGTALLDDADYTDGADVVHTHSPDAHPGPPEEREYLCIGCQARVGMCLAVCLSGECMGTRSFCLDCMAGSHCSGAAECSCDCPVCFWDGLEDGASAPDELGLDAPPTGDPTTAPIAKPKPGRRRRSSRAAPAATATSDRLPTVDQPPAPSRYNIKPSLATSAGGERACIQSTQPAQRPQPSVAATKPEPGRHRRASRAAPAATSASNSLLSVDQPLAPSRYNIKPSLATPAGGERACIQPADLSQHPTSAVRRRPRRGPHDRGKD